MHFPIWMLGSRGVGKTSLLAGMAFNLQDSLLSAGMSVKPDHSSAARLQKLGTQLEKFARGIGEIQPTIGADALNRIDDPYNISVGMLGKNPAFFLDFYDYGGGIIDAPKSVAETLHFQQLIENAVVLLLPIHTPALMEADGLYHDQVNAPNVIRGRLEEALGVIKKPRLLILVPSKCEAYVKTQADSAKLLIRIKERYSGILNLLAQKPFAELVSIACIPVQTVGTRYCIGLTEQEGEPIFQYSEPIGGTSPLQPKNCEQVFYSISAFMIKYSTNHGQNQLFRWFRELLGKNDELKAALDKVQVKRKTSGDGFAILQSNSFF